jgi:arsenite/tail-anchored protein-transporting ATPase
VRQLLLAGSGGAGTTTVAAATAVRAARRGLKTLLLSPEPGALPPLDQPAGGAPGRADREVEPGLVLRTLDARTRAERAWAAVGGWATALLGTLGVDPLQAEELTGLPGLDDVLTLLEIRDAAAAGWDLVVVDAPELSRTVRLLALPEAVARTVARALPLERRMLWAMGHGASPAWTDGVPRPVVEAAEQAQAEIGCVRNVLTGPGTTVRLVVPPQRGPLDAALAAWTALTLHGLTVDGVVVNRLVPAGADPWLRERSRAESVVAADAEEAFAPLPVVRVGELPLPPAGADELAALDVDDLPAPAPAAPRVDRDGDDFTLVLALPRARRTDLGLARRGDELVVDVAGERRVLTLPSVLRRCDVTGAALRDGALRIAFRPDPDLWLSL